MRFQASFKEVSASSIFVFASAVFCSVSSFWVTKGHQIVLLLKLAEALFRLFALSSVFVSFVFEEIGGTGRVVQL